ncbi:Taurine--pyruvate aminotransferase [Nymphon striatum]|nr:Taurine--pyruvate aminotransferase [Nymphon striatum]
MPGEIRIQWWRDLLKSGDNVGSGPLAEALMEVVAEKNLPGEILDNYLQARIFDLYQDPMPDVGTYEGYLGETVSSLLNLILLSCGSEQNAEACKMLAAMLIVVMNEAVNPNDISHVVAADKKHIWHHLTNHSKFTDEVDPLIIVEGKGMRVWNQAGREHLDAVSGGVWTVNVGYGRESIANAVRDQLVKMNYFAGSMGSIPGALFAERLIEKMPGMTRVYYSNSGSEANEKCFKMVRQIAHNKYGGKKNKILYRQRDYHGTTIATLSAGGQDERKAEYGPFTPGFVEVPHCLEYRSQWGEVDDYGIRAANAIEEVILREGPETVGALCLEPITAGGGVIVPPEGYWERVQEICKKYDILLHIDEVVCGMGRTGTWFGYQHYGIEPDMVTMAKGVASGYAAISCTVTTEEVFNMLRPEMSDTMGYFP